MRILLLFVFKLPEPGQIQPSTYVQQHCSLPFVRTNSTLRATKSDSWIRNIATV